MRLLAILAAMAIITGPALAQNKTGAAGFMSSLDGSVVVATQADANTLGPAGAASLSVDGVSSWDLQGDPDNVVMNLDIGAGNEVTGISFDIGIASVGASWCSEADIFFTDSGLTTGVILTPGVGVDMNCDMEFSSGGVNDVTMFGVIAGADGILRVEFADSFDDNPDAIDNNLRNAVVPAVVPGFGLVCTDQGACNAALGGLPTAPAVPVLSSFGLLALGLLLILGALLVMRRKV